MRYILKLAVNLCPSLSRLKCPFFANAFLRRPFHKEHFLLLHHIHFLLSHGTAKHIRMTEGESGEDLGSLEILMRIANSLEVGDTVEVEYFREGELATIKITLPERPAQPGDIPH